MLARYALVLFVLLVCMGSARAGEQPACLATATSATDNVSVYLARHNTARATRAYADGATAALRCAASSPDPRLHRQLVRLAADDYRSAADQTRDGDVHESRDVTARWYAESSHLYNELLGDKNVGKKERDEIQAQIASNDDFASKLGEAKEGVVRDTRDRWAVPMWTSLRRFCHERDALQSTNHGDEVTNSNEVLFIPSGVRVSRLSQREVKCPDRSMTLARVRVLSGSGAQQEGYVEPDDFVAQTAAAIAPH